MELERITGFEDFLRRRDEWNGLLARSAQDSLFLRHEWLSAWWRHHGRERQPLVLILREGQEAIGAAPLMVAKDRMRGLPVRRIAFMGDSAWTPGDFIIAGPKEAAIKAIVENLLRLPLDVIELRNIPGDSDTVPILGDVLDGMGARYALAGGALSPRLAVDRPWDAFYRERSAKFRKVLRNKLNRIGRSRAVSITRHSKPAEVRDAMPVVFAIGQKGWKHRLRCSISSTEKSRAFYLELSNVMSELGWLTVWILRIDGAPVAFEYHVRYGGTIHALVSDFDETYKECCPGSVLDHHIVEHLFQEQGSGCTYDMGCGTQFYKTNWTMDARRHVTVRLFGDTVCGAALQQVETKVAPYLKVVRAGLGGARALLLAKPASAPREEAAEVAAERRREMLGRNIVFVIEDLARGLKREIDGSRVRATNSLIYLTYRCTSQCKTCNIWKRNHDNSARAELVWPQWQTILRTMKAYGIKTVEIFGGDALLRKDLIFEVVRFCSEHGMDTYFPTNSLLFDRETAREFVAAGLGTIYFSLEDVGTGHDEIRGRSGAFSRVKDAIESIAAVRGGGKRPRIIVCTTVSKMNCGRIGDIARFLEGYPVDALYPRILEEVPRCSVESSAVDGVLPEPYFTSGDGASHLLDDREIAELRTTIREARRRRGVYINSRALDMAPDEAFTRGLHPLGKCMVCATLLTVDPMGHAMPCPMYSTYRLGSLLEKEVGEIWGGTRHRLFLHHQRRRQLPICGNCGLRAYYPRFAETLRYYGRRIAEKAAG